jgi:CO/xanthine dehydrogenase Mo-binding subunit
MGAGSPGLSTVAQLALGTAHVVIDPDGGGLFQLRLSQNDMYDIPNRRMIDHRVPGGYLRIGALRAPLDPPYFFAQEGMLDELAHRAQLDPYEFRKRNI